MNGQRSFASRFPRSDRSHAGRRGGGLALGPAAARRPRPARRSARARPALPRQGQARHLPAHGRRPVADRPLRLQAEDERLVRQGPARLDPPGPAADDHDQRPDAVPHRAVEIQVRPARPERHVGQRAAAAHGQDGRRNVLHPQHEHRRHQPRAGHHLRPDGQPDRRPALPGFLGLLRAGHAQPEPADLRRAWWPSRPTWSSFRPSRPGSGRAAICRASMPACRSAPAAIRSCTSTIRRACRPTSAARRSTASVRSTK